ncbi:MAG: outer membrane lipoprotein-sorting protein [Gammaproteobacteria bacterium]|nr:outer membrane lipoprotein-sorting protein [Gammaproteobacteria bacterium]NNF60321.1 outer membrane lipoprotein-sorting protein [Gammaproteobacteria bacterium]NNM20635.1 outer membrane lipoprotein-sorting protein [Gammaproteobacteria bacterium]
MLRNSVLLSVLLSVLTVMLAAGGAAAAEEAVDKGLAIAIEADQRDIGFGDASATLQMILRNRHGDQTTRQMRSRSLEVADDGDKSLMIFDDPADVKGTAFLSFSHKTGDDDQWLYLPALKRVKRISSSNKSGPFMGSEFSYEDLSSQEVEKYTYRYLRDEAFDGRDHFVLERVPVDKKSGYRRQVVWMDKDAYRVWKVEFYDRKDALLKTLVFSGYQQYLDRHWRAGRMDMENHQTGKSTTLLFEDYVFGNGLTDADFNRNSLAKAR